MTWLAHLLALIEALVVDRSQLAMENVALRQQASALVPTAAVDELQGGLLKSYRRCAA